MRKIIIMTLAVMVIPALAGADQARQQKCYELQRATDEARARAHARELALMEQTILQPVPSVADTSCLDSYTLSVDVSKYDPAAVMSVLKQQAEQRA
jgi:hypothetical protein